MMSLIKFWVYINFVVLQTYSVARSRVNEHSILQTIDYQTDIENDYDQFHRILRSTVSNNPDAQDIQENVAIINHIPGFSSSEEKLLEYPDLESTTSSKVYNAANAEGAGIGKEEKDSRNDEEDLYDDHESLTLRVQKKPKVRMEILTKLLRTLETQAQLGSNCVPGTDLNLGDKVVNRYAQERFMSAALVAVNRANWLTRMWKYEPDVIGSSEYLLHTSLYGMIELSDDIFAAGNCYDSGQYKNYFLFCPFGYRLPEGPILVKDLAIEYKYLSNTSEWFYIARKKAEELIKKGEPIKIGYHTYTFNESTHGKRESDSILTVAYDDGQWTKPYYDCGGGNIWMMTYTVPFFGFEDGKYFFKGTSGIDIDLRRVDINQCQRPNETGTLNIFGGTDKCKVQSTKCVSVAGLGFRRGSYKCVCKVGFYFPDVLSDQKYFNGSVLEEEYAKKMEGRPSNYELEEAYQCLPCAPGCYECVDSSPCMATLNWVLRTILLILQCIIICCLPIVVLFTYKYKDIKVVRAASPVILRIIILGAFFVYSTTIVLYPTPSIITCTLRIWLREIGFALSYGALMLKTWRISVIFRVRSAKAIKITDVDLIKRLGVIVGIFVLCLFVRTLVSPPVVIIGLTADNLKAYLCQSDWWDHSFTILEFLFLLWGIRLCIMVRKAPSEFNESKFISMTIYNEFLLSIFLNVSMFFLQHPANPDLLYIIFFCHSQLTITILLCLIFASKFYLVMKGHGKNDEVSWNSKNGPGKFVAVKVKAAQASLSQQSNNTAGLMSQTGAIPYKNNNLIVDANKLTESEIAVELERIFHLLQALCERKNKVEGPKTNSFICSKLENVFEAFKNNEAILPPSSEMPLSSSSPSTESKETPSKNEILEEEEEEEDDDGEEDEEEEEENEEEKDEEEEEEGETEADELPLLAPKTLQDVPVKSCRSSISSCNCSFCCTSSECSYCSPNSTGNEDDDEERDLLPSSDYGKRLEYFNPKIKRNKIVQTDNTSSGDELSYPINDGQTEERLNKETEEEEEETEDVPVSRNTRSGHAQTHHIVINLDEKNRFTNEVTV